MGLHRSRSRRDTLVAYGLVSAQFLFLALLFAWDPPARWRLPAWADRAAALMGLLGAIWLVGGLLALGRSASAVPLPVVHGSLKTAGFYRLSRHPVYTGLLAIGWSAALRAASVPPLAIAAGLSALIAVKARFEEAHLAEAYPGYTEYASRTARFLPVGSLGRRSRR